MNAIIMLVAAVDAARPGEGDIPAGFVDLLHPAFRQLVRHVVGVFFHEGHEHIELSRVHLGSGEAGRLPLKRRLAAGRGQDVLVGDWVHDGDLPLLFVEAPDELHAEVVFLWQGAQTLARPLANFGGVATEEARAVNHLAVHHRIVLAQVVSLDTVSV